MYSGKAPKLSDFVFGTNNFDLIRLLAALQVTLIHGLEHLGIGMPFLLNQIIQSIPGVPIFFVISGYLISASFERRKSLANYYFNRFLRVYPGLWFCLLISILSVVCVYPVSTSLFEGLAWLSA
ncbi:MAG: acyltransferase family protein [Hahellaceae bacterium]|nr:acyltransferase family protein [Hahellaceae bacterium]